MAEKIKALIVEDEKIWQNRLQRWLKEYHCKVDIAGSYEEAIEKLENNAYDMVTLDMALSKEERGNLGVGASSGWELVGQLVERFSGIAMFIVSASFQGEPERVAELIKQYGVRDFKSKGKNLEPKVIKRWVEEVRSLKEGKSEDAGQVGKKTLPPALHNKIVTFLSSIPAVGDSKAQQALINSAGLDSQLHEKIDFAGSRSQFFQLLVPLLSSYGTLEDGRNALEAVLETAENYVGQDRRADCDELIQELHGI